MIPVELDVQNFLAYRHPGPLRLEGIHIACLAGPNGAGQVIPARRHHLGAVGQGAQQHSRTS